MVRRLFFALALVLWSQLTANAAELDERRAFGVRAVQLLESEQFELLDKELTTQRVSKQRTASGTWAYWYSMSALKGYVGRTRDANGATDGTISLLTRWQRVRPASPVPAVLKASLYLAVAFEFRGSGMAKDVPPDAWLPFQQNVDRARLELDYTQKFSSIDPEWYSEMLLIAVYQQWPEDQFSALLAAAVKREPTYHGVYFNAMERMSPLWGGSAEVLDAFSRAAIQLVGPEEGPTMYARLAWYSEQRGFFTKDALFKQSKFSWPLVSKSADALLAKYPEDWNLNNMARLACLAGDVAKTREMLLRVGDKPIPAAWNGKTDKKFSVCRQFAGLSGMEFVEPSGPQTRATVPVR